MNRQIAAFKRIAAQVAHREGVGMAAFISERGLNEFLLDESDNTDVVDIAAKALLVFCVEDGQFNGFIVGVKTVVQFLGEHRTAIAPGGISRQGLVDLREVLETQPTLKSIKNWIASYYGRA